MGLPTNPGWGYRYGQGWINPTHTHTPGQPGALIHRILKPVTIPRNVVRYKAQLVAQGFSQVPRVGYFDTIAPVAWLASIHTVLAFVATENYEKGQIEVLT